MNKHTQKFLFFKYKFIFFLDFFVGFMFWFPKISSTNYTTIGKDR